MQISCISNRTKLVWLIAETSLIADFTGLNIRLKQSYITLTEIALDTRSA